MPLLVPHARRASRAVALGTVALGTVASRGGARPQQALVLGALSLGMPHGAADTELLRQAAGGSRGRHAALLLGYAAASELEIRDGVKRLAQALETLARSGGVEHGVNGVQGIPSANGHASATGVTRATGAERDRSVGQVPKVWPAR